MSKAEIKKAKKLWHNDYSPLRDCIAANLLADKGVMKVILKAITGEDYDIVDILQRYAVKGRDDNFRIIIFDTLVYTKSGCLINLEIQIKFNKHSYGLRIHNHKSRLIGEQLQKGENFEESKKVRVIFINLEASSENGLDVFNDVYSSDDIDHSKVFSFNLFKVNDSDGVEQNLVRAFFLFAANEDDLNDYCEERNMSINNPTLNVLIKGYKRIMSLPFIKKEIKRPQKFEELSERDQEYFEVREYPLVKLYYEGELARIEDLRKKRNEKLKQASEKLKQESEKKELLLCVVALNLFDSGMPLD